MSPAIQYNHSTVVEQLLVAGASPTKESSSSLIMLSEMFQPAHTRPTPLEIAVYLGHVIIVKQLMKHGANLDNLNNIKLLMLAFLGNSKRDSLTPGTLESIQLILNTSLCINCLNSVGDLEATPLFHAISTNAQHEIIQAY